MKTEEAPTAPVDAVVQLRWSEMIVHMTGSGEHIKKSAHGYRNHYCATVESQQYSNLMTMEEHGLVVGGVFLNQRQSRYFHATEKGCAFAGMSKVATKRATSS